jgi:dTDP-4-amino-4,6-dideoxygalactose transaminase
MFVPFNKVSLVGNELKYIRSTVEHCHLSGDGPFSKRCEAHLEKSLGAPRVLLTSSCTHALELAALLADIRPGDEFIVPSFTFPSTVNAFILRGAVPRFVDIRADTFNIDEKLVAKSVTRKTKVLCAVHYSGVPCEMAPLIKIARARKLSLIEDAAQAYLSEYRGKKAGTFGELAALSFHETKNVICGEGGALIINKRAFVRRAEIIRQKGTNRAAFYRGEVDKYSWVDVGSSFVPSELQSAFLAAQFEKNETIMRKRKAAWHRYYEALQPLAEAGSISLQAIPAHCRSSYHLFAVVFESEKKRDSVMKHSKAKGIHAIFHYFPLHLSTMGQRYGYRKGMLPVTERISACLLRLPLYNDIDWPSQRYVIETLKKEL